MNDVRFEELPDRQGRGPGKHAAIAEQLRTRPGEWAVIATYAHSGTCGSMAQGIKRGLIRAYAPEGAFEAVSRTVDGEHRVYARYVGEGRDE